MRSRLIWLMSSTVVNLLGESVGYVLGNEFTSEVQLDLVDVPDHQVLEVLEPEDVLVIDVLNIPKQVSKQVSNKNIF